MLIRKSLEEGKPIQQIILETEIISEDSLNYQIKMINMQDKLTLSASHKKGIICKNYCSEYDLKGLSSNQNFSFKNIEEYSLFLQDILNSNKLLKIDNKIKKSENGLTLIILAKFGIIKEIIFEIKEKEITEKEMKNNIMDYV